MLLIYVFQYEKAYEEYPEEQIKSLGSRWEDLQYYETLYSNRVEQLEEYDPEYERLEPIKKTAGILVSLRALCGLQVDCWEDWEKNEDMLRDLQKQEDRKLVDAPDKIDPGGGALFYWDRRDWNQRMLLHEAYEKADVPEPVNKAVPTGAYVLYHGLEGTGVVFLVLALLMNPPVNYYIHCPSPEREFFRCGVSFTGDLACRECWYCWGFFLYAALFVLGLAGKTSRSSICRYGNIFLCFPWKQRKWGQEM